MLVQIEEGPTVRCRRHTGHAFSLKSLMAQVNEAIDSGLWTTLQAVEEQLMLLRQMHDLAQDSSAGAGAGAGAGAAKLRMQADESEKRLQPLRELVLDPGFFGHAPK